MQIAECNKQSSNERMHRRGERRIEPSQPCREHPHVQVVIPVQLQAGIEDRVIRTTVETHTAIAASRLSIHSAHSKRWIFETNALPIETLFMSQQVVVEIPGLSAAANLPSPVGADHRPNGLIVAY